MKKVLLRILKKTWSYSLLAECYMWGYLDIIAPSAKLKAWCELRAWDVGLAAWNIWKGIEN
jgi:hypothetical protein